jgi:hypothetical protein
MTTATDPVAPSASRYVAAFQAIESLVTDGQRGMLKAHYNAPGRTLTMTEVAHSVGYQSYRAGNLWYGRLGGMLCDELSWRHGVAIHVLVTFTPPDATPHGEWELHLRPEVAEALERLRWV